jgi:hypothetical protein
MSMNSKASQFASIPIYLHYHFKSFISNIMNSTFIINFRKIDFAI